MTNNSLLEELEQRIRALPSEQQLCLIERLVRGLRRQAEPDSSDIGAQLAAMAADPEIQEELRRIDEELGCDRLKMPSGIASGCRVPSGLPHGTNDPASGTEPADPRERQTGHEENSRRDPTEGA